MLMMGLSIIGVLMLMMGVPRRSARQGGGVSRSVGPPVAVCGGALACRGPCALHPCGAVLRGWRRGGEQDSRGYAARIEFKKKDGRAAQQKLGPDTQSGSRPSGFATVADNDHRGN